MTIFPSVQIYIHVDVDVDFINNLLNDMPCITVLLFFTYEIS